MQEPKVEIVRYRKEGEYYDIQLAIDGVLSVPLEVHASARECYSNDSRGELEWFQYLQRSSETLIQVYGDARYQRPLEMYDPSLAGSVGAA